MIKKIVFFTCLLAYCATAPLDKCPTGTVFNSAIQICDWPNNVGQTATQASVTFAPVTFTQATFAPVTFAPVTFAPVTFAPVTQSGEFSNLNFGTTQFVPAFTAPTVPTQFFQTTATPFTSTVSPSFFNTQTVTTPFQSIEFSNLNNGNSQVNFQQNGVGLTTTSPFAFTTTTFFTPSFTEQSTSTQSIGNPSELVHFLNVLGETTLSTTTAKVPVFNHIPTDMTETSKSSGKLPNKVLVSFRPNQPSLLETETSTPSLEMDTTFETTRRMKTTTTTTTEFVPTVEETETAFETTTVKTTPKKKLRKTTRVNNLVFEEVSGGKKHESDIEGSSTVSNMILSVTIPTPSNTKADKKVLITSHNLHLLHKGSSRVATTTPEVLLDETETQNEEEQITTTKTTKTIPKKVKKSKHKKLTTTTVSNVVQESIDDTNEEVTTVSSTTVLTTTHLKTTVQLVDFTLTELPTEPVDEQVNDERHTTVITITKDVTRMMIPKSTTTESTTTIATTTQEMLDEEEPTTVETTTRRRKITTVLATVVFTTPSTTTESTTTNIATKGEQVMVFETTQSLQTDSLVNDEGINNEETTLTRRITTVPTTLDFTTELPITTQAMVFERTTRELLNEEEPTTVETITTRRKITTGPTVIFTTPSTELTTDKLEVENGVDTLNEEEITTTTRRLMVAQTTTAFTERELNDVETTNVVEKKGNFRRLTTTPVQAVEEESPIQRDEIPIASKTKPIASHFEMVEITTTPTTTVKIDTSASANQLQDMSGLNFEEVTSNVKPRKVKSNDKTESNDE